DTATALDNHQQDINSKSDTQTYNVYLVPNGYEPLLSTKKKNLKKIPRPKNCFMAYRMDKQHEIMKQWPGVNNKDISRIVGSMWKQESEEEKGRYKAIAEELKKCHAREYPGYKFSPKKKTQKNNLKKQEPQLGNV
ncbi:high mobility group box domain-containing protein, partial [Jimgerdemannia flammicorona]